jgi:tetratricopeptide (TPR) repeat protein
MAKVRQLEAPGEADGVEPGLDPIAETRQKSLTMLAGLLFEIEEVERTDPSRKRGLRSIVSGTGSLHKPKEFDHTKIMLHLSQMIDHQTQGELDQAAEELERAMDAGLEHPAAYFDLGFLHAQSRQGENALRHLQLAMKQPDFALGSRLLLGEILRDMGRSKDAAVEYLEALRVADADVVPENQREDLYQLYEPMIEELRQEESTDAQERVCDNVSDLLMRTDWRENLVHARQQLVSQQNGGPIVPLAEVIIQSRSSQIVDSLTKIYDMAHRGYFRSAMEEAFYALQYAPTYLPLHTYMGELLLQEDQMQDAINKFIAVAQTYSTRGEVRRAIDLYRRVIELAPMDLKPRNRLIELLIDLNHLPEALSEYLDYADVYYSIADLDMARKTYTDALRLAQNSNMDRSWRVKILHRMADIDLQSLDWRQALRIYEQIRTIQPDDAEARSRLVELNLRLGQQVQALSELDNYVTLLMDSERVDAALKFVEGLVREDPERPQVRTRLASIYQHMGLTEKAINQLDTAGEQFLDQGDRNNAIRTVETIVNFNPVNVAQYQRLLQQLKKD